MADKPATVSVLYALAEEQILIELAFEPGLTARAAVECSGITERFPAIASEPLVLGVWGAPVEADHELNAGDRVEISRPLVADPRTMRRELMDEGRVMGGASAPAESVRKGRK